MKRDHRLRFRDGRRVSEERAEHDEGRLGDPVGRARRAAFASGGANLVLAAIWILGLVMLVSVIEFEVRVDETRRAQVVISEMRIQQIALIQLAFNPAVAVGANLLTPAETKRRSDATKDALSQSVATLKRLGHSDAPRRIELLTERYYAFTDHLSLLAASNGSAAALAELGQSQQPGGVQADMNAEFTRADLDYGRDATRSRKMATAGSIVAMVSLLAAFTLAFRRSVRARRRSDANATTDALTGLGNRRKLFADMERTIGRLGDEGSITIGIFDLDGFKAYNDMFGHPAGDALLARLARRLSYAVADRGDAYRIGGDEFVVTTAVSPSTRLLKAAQAALSEKGDAFLIGCSFGSTRVVPGVTLEQALLVADRRLYADKRSGRSDRRTEVKDVLLQVLAEQSGELVAHLGHVAGLVWSTAIRLGLPGEQIERARLAGELHDIGKAAIPSEILDKPGPLDSEERQYTQRHSEIGERIVAAATTLLDVAPVVRSVHERIDGTGYPDGLRGDEIPICSRIIAVVDAYDAMTTDRPYQMAMSATDAVAELRISAGTQFDPVVVNAFIAVLGENPQPPRAYPAPNAVPDHPLIVETRHSRMETVR